MMRHYSLRMGSDDPSARLLADDASGYFVGGIVTSMLVALVAGAVIGVVVRLLGRRGSWSAAGVLSVLGLVAGPVGVVMISSLIGGFLTGNGVAARRLAS
jgi:hypothetical protein